MAYQFIHINTPARVAKTVSKGRRKGEHVMSARETCAEAQRLDGAANHVEHPQEPKLLHGVMPMEALAMAEAWAAQAKQENGKAWRADAPIMAAGVVSAPDDMDAAAWAELKARSMAWMIEKYGDRLKSVIEHEDEPRKKISTANPRYDDHESGRHMHFYAVAHPGEDFAVLDAAYGAQRDARRALKGKTPSPGDGGLARKAYIDAQMALQDDFHKKVSSHVGLERIGPRRARVSRAERLAELADGKVQQLDKLSEQKTKQVQRLDKAIAVRVEKAKVLEKPIGLVVSLFDKATGSIKKPLIDQVGRLKAENQRIAAEAAKKVEQVQLEAKKQVAEVLAKNDTEKLKTALQQARNESAELRTKLMSMTDYGSMLLKDNNELKQEKDHAKREFERLDRVVNPGNYQATKRPEQVRKGPSPDRGRSM